MYNLDNFILIAHALAQRNMSIVSLLKQTLEMVVGF